MNKIAILLKKIKIKTIIKIVIISIILHSVYVFISISRFGEVTVQNKCETAIVLGAGLAGNNPSPVFRERLNHAIKLYKEGYLTKIILTGGKGEGSVLSDSAVAKKYVLSQNVRSNDILIEEESTITETNIQNAVIIMQEYNLTDAYIISDPLHMKRAMLVAKDIGNQKINFYPSPTQTSMYRTNKSKLTFLLRETFFYSLYKVKRLFL